MDMYGEGSGREGEGGEGTRNDANFGSVDHSWPWWIRLLVSPGLLSPWAHLRRALRPLIAYR